jgi:hypothetical protein
MGGREWGQVVSAGTSGIGGNVAGNTAPPRTLVVAPAPGAGPSPAPTPTPPASNLLLDARGGYLLDSNRGKVTAL